MSTASDLDSEASSNRIHDRCASSYGFDIDATLVSRLKYDLLKKYTTPTSQLLDVGCANGLYLQAIARSCTHITGIDINDKMLEIAREKVVGERIENATLLKGNALSLSFRDGSFDLAYTFSTLLMISDVRSAVAEMARVIKPGGHVVLDINGRHNVAHRSWDQYYRSQGHPGISAFSHGEITALVESLGLRFVEEHANGVTDQWKHMRVLHRLKFLDRIFHSSRERDLDSMISNTWPMNHLANRWFFVYRKGSQA